MPEQTEMYPAAHPARRRTSRRLRILAALADLASLVLAITSTVALWHTHYVTGALHTAACGLAYALGRLLARLSRAVATRAGGAP